MLRGALPVLAFALVAGTFLGSPAATAQRRVAVAPMPAQPRETVRVVTSPQPAHVISRLPISRPVVGQREETHPAARVTTHTRENRFMNGNRGIGCNGVSIQQLLNPTPSFGFNYEYLNAVDQDLAVKAAIDPATQLALREAGRFGCATLGGGGYVLWGGGYGYPTPEDVEEQPEESSEPTQPQVIVVQVPSTTGAVATGTSAGSSTGSSAQSANEASESAEPDEVQFVLVMRDGTQLQTAAFTRSANSIIYITSEGARRSIQIPDLDTDATIRANNERGTQLQLSL